MTGRAPRAKRAAERSERGVGPVGLCPTGEGTGSPRELEDVPVGERDEPAGGVEQVGADGRRQAAGYEVEAAWVPAVRHAHEAELLEAVHEGMEPHHDGRLGAGRALRVEACCDEAEERVLLARSAAE